MVTFELFLTGYLSHIHIHTYHLTFLGNYVTKILNHLLVTIYACIMIA